MPASWSAFLLSTSHRLRIHHWLIVEVFLGFPLWFLSWPLLSFFLIIIQFVLVSPLFGPHFWLFFTFLSLIMISLIFWLAQIWLSCWHTPIADSKDSEKPRIKTKCWKPSEAIEHTWLSCEDIFPAIVAPWNKGTVYNKCCNTAGLTLRLFIDENIYDFFWLFLNFKFGFAWITD